jgi:acetylornithine/succinyldiaminopimelate/putrescine aminotransferase
MNKQLSKTAELTDKHIMNTYKRLPIAIEKGEGVHLYDEQGKKYLDFTSGIAVNSLGYKNPKFIEAMLSQAELLNHCSNLYYSKHRVSSPKN